MKKLILSLVAVLILFVAGSFLLIPSSTIITKELSFRIPYSAVYRELIEKNDWNNWWPRHQSPEPKNEAFLYSFQDTRFRINKKTVNSISLYVENGERHSPAELLLIPLRQDSVKLVWQLMHSNASLNPFKRIAGYLDQESEGKKLGTLLHTFQEFMTNPVRLYGVDIKKDRVVDSLLVSTFRYSDSIPSMEYVYEIVQTLRQFIQSKKAQETGNPMLNISQLDTRKWTVRVAIPVDRKLPSEGTIAYKWMLGGGHILTTEVKGGLATINKALEGMDNYVKDNQLTPPAIPFQSMITDRSRVKDSTQWITKLYYPVM